MYYRSSLLALALATAVAPALPAQAAPPRSPNLLLITRESIKPGKYGAYDKLEAEGARAMAAAKAPYGRLVLRAYTGPRESWAIEAFPSFAEYERLNMAYAANAELSAIGPRIGAQESDILGEGRTMVLQLRDSLSYGAAADMAHMRFFAITRVSVRPGHVAEFVEARKLIKQAHETARLTDSYGVYEATAGVPAGTFYVFAAHKAAAELDSGAMVHGADYLAALGGDEGRKKLAALQASFANGSETDYFGFVPAQSVVNAAWLRADPTFWKHQTTPPAR